MQHNHPRPLRGMDDGRHLKDSSVGVAPLARSIARSGGHLRNPLEGKRIFLERVRLGGDGEDRDHGERRSGGYFGARLAQAGEDVTFIARGRQLAAMRQAGLRVESRRGDVHLLPVRVVRDPASIGLVDLVLFTVKLWSTEEAGHQLAPLIGPDTMVMSLQNGVDANGILAGLVGRERLVGGVCYIAAVIDRPGVIQHTGQMARLIFGEFGGRKKTRRAERFLEACAPAKAGFDAELSGDIERAIWEKFIFLVGLSAMTSLTRRSIGAVRSDPDTRAMLLDLLREAVAVGR